MRRIQSVVMGAALAIAATTAAAPATAALITDWTVTISNNWSGTSFASSGPGSTDPVDPFGVFGTLPDGSDPSGGSYDVIRWGTPATSAGRSFLAIDDTLTVGGLITNDANGVEGVNLYHGNYRQQISSSVSPAERWLDNTTLLSTITVSRSSDPDEVVATSVRTFPIDFLETVNSANLASCEGAPWSSGTTGCPDRFTALVTESSFSFIFEGFRYIFSVIFDSDNSQNVNRVEDGNDGSSTIWTNEDVRSRLATRIIVRAEAVPEPAALGLLGAGLALAGLMRKRRA